VVRRVDTLKEDKIFDMSRVTNLLLLCTTLESIELIIGQIATYKYGSSEFRIVSVNDSSLPESWYGGNRRLECNILLGAYNYLELDDFVSFLRDKVTWEAIDLVQLVVKEDHEMKFRLIDLVE